MPRAQATRPATVQTGFVWGMELTLHIPDDLAQRLGTAGELERLELS